MRAAFLHAFGADKLSWAGTTPALGGVECITPDLPGHGTAVADLGDASLGDLAGRTEARIGPGPGALVGHSLGGALALELAARRPRKVSSLVLLCPLGLGVPTGLDTVLGYPDIATADQMRAFLESLVVKTSIVAPQFVEYGLTQLEAPGARAALRAIAGNLATIASEMPERVAAVEQAGIEVTLIWGAGDPLATPDGGLIPARWAQHVLPAVGHIPHVEAAREVNGILKAAIAR